MLIDGGGRDASSYVVACLKQMGVESLDYVAVSHYDEDHMSGTVGALTVFPCQTLLLPSYAGESELYASFAKAAVSNGCSILHAKAGQTFQMGDAAIEVVGPLNGSYENENNRSLAFRISYGDVSCLICGDAEEQSELDMAASGENLSADIYVVNHHGGSTASTDAFLDVVSPVYAIVSCGLNNKYGHPSMEALQRLQNHNVLLFRTDLQGTISAYSDGDEIWFNTEATSDWTSGTIQETRSMPLDEVEEPLEQGLIKETTEIEYSYVCNTNTKKFHYPDCRSVSQMKEENRLYTDKSRDELLAEGYEPCGGCNP